MSDHKRGSKSRLLVLALVENLEASTPSELCLDF
jgi:hypothetical protein